MPTPGSDERGVREELTRVRDAVEAGETDLKALGFWRLVARVKRDPALIEAHADEIGAIDRTAFERRKRFRPPVWLGNAVLLVGTAAMVALVVIAIDLADEVTELVQGAEGAFVAVDVQRPGQTIWPGILLLAAAGGLSVTLHSLGHWVVGRAAGIRFSSYFLNGPFRIQPGIKTDYATYLRADPRARARMHAAGAVASKLAPFAVFAPAYVAHATYDFFPYELFPEWALWGVLGLGVVQIVTDVVWSTKKSDWKKYSREKAIARDLYSSGRPGSSDGPG